MMINHLRQVRRLGVATSLLTLGLITSVSAQQTTIADTDPPAQGGAPVQQQTTVPQEGWQYLLSSPVSGQLRGHNDKLELDIYIDEPAEGSIIFAYEGNETLWADKSQFALSINGEKVASTPLRAVEEGKTARWIVPLKADAFRTGWNKVILGADLWRGGPCMAGPEGQAQIMISPHSSIINLPTRSLSSRINPGLDGQLDVVIVEPDLANSMGVGKALLAAQEVGRRLPDAAATVQLRTRTLDQPVDLMLDLREGGAVDAPNTMDLAEFQRTVPLRSQQQAENYPLLEANHRYTFDEFGVRTSGWSEHYHEIDFNFALPDDFYGMQTGSLRLDLKATAARAIPADARMSALMNGDHAASIKIAGSYAGESRNWTVDIPLHKARPGDNVMTLAFDVPPEDGDPCLTSLPHDHKPLFGIYDTSSVKLSSFARATVASPVTTLTPGGGLPLTIVAPHASEALYTAAGRLLASVAAETNEVRPVDVSTQVSASRNALFIAGARDLDSRIGDWFGLPQAQLRRWQRQNSDGAVQDAASQGWIDDFGSANPANTLSGKIGQTWNLVESGTFPQPSDTAALISSPTKGGSRTLFVALDHDSLALTAEAVEKAPGALLHSSGVIMAEGGEIRTVDSMRGARPSTYSLGNMRLFAAGFFSKYVWLYTALIILAAILLGTLSWVALSHRSND